MRWEAKVLLCWYALAMIVTVLNIGQPKTPTTPKQATLGLVVIAGLAYLVYRLGAHR